MNDNICFKNDLECSTQELTMSRSIIKEQKARIEMLTKGINSLYDICQGCMNAVDAELTMIETGTHREKLWGINVMHKHISAVKKHLLKERDEYLSDGLPF